MPNNQICCQITQGVSSFEDTPFFVHKKGLLIARFLLLKNLVFLVDFLWGGV